MIAISRKCKFTHPCCYILLTANAGMLFVKIYTDKKRQLLTMTMVIAQFRTYYKWWFISLSRLLSFFPPYPLALVIVRNQSDFPCKDTSTAKNTYKPLPSPHIFLDIHGYQPSAQPLSGNSTPLIYSWGPPAWMSVASYIRTLCWQHTNWFVNPFPIAYKTLEIANSLWQSMEEPTLQTIFLSLASATHHFCVLTPTSTTQTVTL